VKWLRWFEYSEKRTAKRHAVAQVFAHYWNGTLPTAHPIRDISQGGAFLVTDERWHIDTLLMMTLQRGEEVTDASESLTVPCRIVRHAKDGLGICFMLTTKKEVHALRRFVQKVTGTRGAVSLFRNTGGEAIVEFALMVPLVFLLLVNAFNFGSFIYCWLTIADAVRGAADYACTDSNTADAPTTPSVSQLTSVVQNATSGLPNYSSSNPVVTACEYDNGTTTTFQTSNSCPNGVTAPPADPEPIALNSTTTYATVAVDVTYTFSPLLGGSRFFTFGLPSLPSTIHRRMVVRWP
jgi:Flp pilus assembly protein TadG